MSSLNQQQLECVRFRGPALMCVAIPGSGKTRTLTHAIADRILSGEVHPSRILAVTFTRLAAAEMRKRLQAMLPDDRGLTIGTFHSICYDLIRQHWRELGYACADIAVYDRVEQKALLKETIFTSRYSPSQTAVMTVIEEMARTGEPPPIDTPRDVIAIVELYIRQLKEHNAIDYSLVPYLAHRLILDHQISLWSDIFVDECQDLDSLQHKTFVLMRPQRIFFVGDSDQLIYGWRGSSVDLMRRMQAEWNATIKVLDFNYRSSTDIIGAANRLIVHNVNRYKKEMRGGNGQAGNVEFIDESQLVPHLASRASAMPGDHSFAVLARTHAMLARFTCDLDAAGVKHDLIGRRDKLLERHDIKTALSYLAWPDLPLSPTVMQRVLAYEGMTDLAIEEVRAEAKRNGRTFFEVAMQRLGQLSGWYADFHDAGMVERMAGVFSRMRKVGGGMDRKDEADLIGVLTTFVRLEPWSARTPGRLIAWLNLRDGQDEVRPECRVQLMTVHAAKGLEFDTVYIVGLDDRTMPFKRAHGDVEAIEEERRLMFVAMTRARCCLVLCEPPENPSRFLQEIKMEWP